MEPFINSIDLLLISERGFEVAKLHLENNQAETLESLVLCNQSIIWEHSDYEFHPGGLKREQEGDVQLPFHKLINLRSLTIKMPDLKIFPDLEDLVNLETLYLHIFDGDVPVLEKFSKLRTLTMIHCLYRNLQYVQKLSNLENLEIFFTKGPRKDIEALLGKLTQLKSLVVDRKIINLDL